MNLDEMLASIPPEELQQVEKFVRVGKAGDRIITEGEPNDDALYLLRAGKIGVFRDIGGMLEKVSEFEANAFFGEMELFESRGLRLATCSIVSEHAVYYRFTHPDLHTIIKNPVWGELLIRRLCLDLHALCDRIVELEKMRAGN